MFSLKKLNLIGACLLFVFVSSTKTKIIYYNTVLIFSLSQKNIALSR